MLKEKYITLSTGYKVDLDADSTLQKITTEVEEQLIMAIIGECLVDVKEHQNWETVTLELDAVCHRIYQECSYLSLRYGVSIFLLLHKTLTSLIKYVEDAEKMKNGQEDLILHNTFEDINNEKN